MPSYLVHLGVMAAVSLERDRQEQLKHAGRFAHTCSDVELDELERFAILVEEIGEVARALNDDQGRARLRAELVQVAAVAVAWIEGLDRQGPVVTPTSAAGHVCSECEGVNPESCRFNPSGDVARVHPSVWQDAICGVVFDGGRNVCGRRAGHSGIHATVEGDLEGLA